MPAPTHSDEGFKGWLVQPAAYRWFGRLLGARRVRDRLVREYIRPPAGARILDLGCGPADLLAHLPASIGKYVGIDSNPAYIREARTRWRDRPAEFSVADVNSAASPPAGAFDIVLAIALLHHLDDAAVRKVCAMAHAVLVPGGRFITYDNVYIDGQHPFARWLIARDRGAAVRTVESYRALAGSAFTDVQGDVGHDWLRVPYSIYVMTCTKR
jgi:SAM-dependent methyltransferase